MTKKPFLHDHADFRDLIAIVSAEVGVVEALVEKDYWVTHTLWSLGNSGLTVLFKGGTSLSKGYGLIERFSEDLDVKIECANLPEVSSWTSSTKGVKESRQQFFHAVLDRIVVPGAKVSELEELRDHNFRNVVFGVEYSGCFLSELPQAMRPFVQIEVGSARVNPGELRNLTSWVHEYVNEQVPELAGEHVGNRPEVHCVYPTVTLLEKIESIGKNFGRPGKPASAVVRHYEDVCKILSGTLDGVDSLVALLEELRQESDIKRWPRLDDPAFNYDDASDRWSEMENAWEAIGPMFWGERIPLRNCAERIWVLLQELERKQNLA